jgi:hypothetical protein
LAAAFSILPNQESSIDFGKRGKISGKKIAINNRYAVRVTVVTSRQCRDKNYKKKGHVNEKSTMGVQSKISVHLFFAVFEGA